MASLADMIRQNKMRPIDQNPLLGKVSSVLGSAREYGNKVNLPVFGGLGDMFVGKAPEEIENWSYGNSPFQSTEMGLPQIKRERKQSLVDALSTLAGPVSGLAKATEGLPAGLAIKSYHASPYRFDNFDISKIGTGEGAQAYGRGLYFAEHPMVADDYLREFKSNKNKDSTIYEVDLSWPNKTQEELDPLNKKHLLDYKKDISKQSKYIQNAIENARNKANEDTSYKGHFISGHRNQTGEDLLERYGEDRLLQAGIPGIRYLDKGSRSQDLNRKTYNLVMFGDEYPQIVNRAGSLDQLLKGK